MHFGKTKFKEYKKFGILQRKYLLTSKIKLLIKHTCIIKNMQIIQYTSVKC